MRTLLQLSWCGLIGLIVPDLVEAQSPAANGNAAKVVRVTRVDTPPVIDGHLDDAAWAQAEVITDFHQIRPGDGTQPSERTEVYLVYGPDALYIGARMYDSEPERMATPTVRHGQGLGRDDRLVVILDPFNTRRGGYRFETNLNGVRHDALYDNPDSFNSNWTVIWDTKATRFDKGWMSELEIPFKTLPFDPASDTWGFNFGRSIRRRGEEVAWVSRNRSYNPGISGVATGFSGLSQGRGLDVVPSLSFNQRKAFAPSSTDANVEPSLDVFYRVTPSLNASLTVNTDFSATEVDDRQVNLTRFNLFFPEKRDFFLNDADLFEFGRISNSGNAATSASSENNGRPFFSRRLGLSPSGTPVDLRYGGKLSGRVGRWTVGALAVQQDGVTPADSPHAALVARVSANVLSESSVGMITTAGDPNSDRDNALVGADFRYLNTHLPGGRVMQADAWYQHTTTEDLAGNDSAFGLGVRMPNNTGWRGGGTVKVLQRNFAPALGFVNRADVRDAVADAGYTIFPRTRHLQSMFFGVDAQRVDYLGGGLQSQVVLGRVLELRNNTGDAVNVHYSATREAVNEPFTIYRDNVRQVVVPPGRYSFGETVLSGSTAGQRRWSGGVTYRTGAFYDGDRTNLIGDLSWKPSRLFALGARYDWNDIDLPEGAFITRLMRLTTDVNFSSTLYWVSLIQYDNVSEVIGVNTRLNWIPKAGQEGLIVFNHSLHDRDRDDVFRSELLDVSVKLNYTFRF